MGATSTVSVCVSKKWGEARRSTGISFQLTNIAADNFHAGETVKYGQKLPSSPSSNFGCAGCWCESGVQYIDVDADVDLGSLESLLQLVDQTLRTQAVKIPGSDNLKSTRFVVLEVVFSSIHTTSL